MTNQQYRAIGYFYANYENNLKHLSNFKKFIKNKLSFEIYGGNEENTFSHFINDFKVARNIKKGNKNKLLHLTQKWISTKSPHEVDLFAIEIKNESISKNLVTSLASKILFLNDPYKIMPLDTRVKKSICCKSNLYSDFLPMVIQVRSNKKFRECCSYITKFAEQVEKDYSNDLEKIIIIRENRMLDLFLWANNGEIY